MTAPHLFDTSGGIARRRPVDTQDFVAVILVGYGESLYPFNEGTNVLSKALMPIGNVPIINLVIDWVLDSGLTDILMIVPPTFHSSISNHLAENYSSSTHPRLRIDLKRHSDGEKDEDEYGSEGPGARAPLMGGREGTARLLRRFRHIIKSDFVLLPCDLSTPPDFTLAKILDKHRAVPDAVLTSVFYEPVEAIKEDEEKILVAVDKESEELLLVEPLEGMEDDFDLRSSLLSAHPSLSLSTRLLDSHIYVFRRTVLDLLATRRPRDLASVREQFVPWLIKGAWQRQLTERWAPILNPPRRDPFAAALARSTAASPFANPYLDGSSDISPSSDRFTSLPATTPGSPKLSDPENSAAYDGVAAAGIGGVFPSKKNRRKHPNWKCQVLILEPEPIPPPAKGDKGKNTPIAEPAYLIRANSLAGYWELNRRFLRNRVSKSAPPVPAAARIASEDGSAGPTLIHPHAQISPDSLIGEGTKVGEKASIKKCVVGRHCNIGAGAKITGSVLWDFVTVEPGARIENAILCSNVRIGEEAQVTNCEFGTGFEVKPSAKLKGERLVAGQEV